MPGSAARTLRPNGSVGWSSSDSSSSSFSVAAPRAASTVQATAPATDRAAVRIETPVNSTMATTSSATRTVAAPKPPSPARRGLAIDRPDPAPGRGQLGRGRPEGRRASGQSGQSGHRHEGERGPDHRPGGLPLDPALPVVAPPDQQEDPDGHGHRGHEEPPPAEEVTHPQSGPVARRVERIGVERQCGQDAHRDQPDTPYVAGMGGDHRAERGAEPLAPAPPGAGCPGRCGAGRRPMASGAIASPRPASSSTAVPRIGPPVAWWRSSQ